ESTADRAAVRRAERREQAEADDGDTRAEGPHVHELAAGDHQPAEREKDDRSRIRRTADDRLEPVGDGAADGAPVPAQVEDRREEEPERDQREAHELVVLLALRLALLLLLDPRGQAWAKRALLLAARHGAQL